MQKTIIYLLLSLHSVSLYANVQSKIKSTYSKYNQGVEAFYRDLHQYPELSGKEFKTSKKMINELKKIGYDVTSNVGGTGLVAVLKNGSGPTVWLRADMDGLPVQEESKKSYASKIKGVMHACGHDTHMAAMIGYASVLKDLKKEWKGTLVLIGQPAEEVGQGAKAMIDDGLYKKFPKPDLVLGLHVSGSSDTGKVTYTSGYALAAVDSIDITVNGLGGHGAAPEYTIDPVVLASKIVVNLQTLVSRNIKPSEPVVLTFGSIHGGTKHNIIPNKVHLQGTLRTYTKEVRTEMISGIKRMTKALASAEKAPKSIIKFSQSLPPTYNDPELTKKMLPIFKRVVGKNNVSEQPGIMGAEDFAHYSRDKKYPTMFYFIGGAPKNKKNFGSNHNSKFAPEYKEMLKVGVEIMALSVTEFLPN